MQRKRPTGLTLCLALLIPLAFLAAAPPGAAGATEPVATPVAAPARQATSQVTSQVTSQATRHAKRQAARHVVRRSHGYGFLPGYRPPEQVEWEDAIDRWRRWPGYWYGWPRFYRGRWNGGGFGPCWTQTPIGNVWNCGR